MGSNPVQAWIFLNSAYYFKAHFHVHEMFSYTSISQVFLNFAVMTYDNE